MVYVSLGQSTLSKCVLCLYQKKGQNKAFVCTANTHCNEGPKKTKTQQNPCYIAKNQSTWHRCSPSSQKIQIQNISTKHHSINISIYLQIQSLAHFSIIILQECTKFCLEQAVNYVFQEFFTCLIPPHTIKRCDKQKI